MINKGDERVVDTVIGLFKDHGRADQALADLEEAGFTRDEIGLLAQRDAVEELVDADREEAAIESAGAGAVGGSALGGLIGLMAGASAVVVPGIGPALAVGALSSILGTTAAGAGVGAAYGGLVGALIGFGVTEEQTHIYVEGVQQGGILIVVQPEDDNLVRAEEILRDHGGVGVSALAKETDV